MVLKKSVILWHLEWVELFPPPPLPTLTSGYLSWYPVIIPHCHWLAESLGTIARENHFFFYWNWSGTGVGDTDSWGTVPTPGKWDPHCIGREGTSSTLYLILHRNQDCIPDLILAVTQKRTAVTATEHCHCFHTSCVLRWWDFMRASLEREALYTSAKASL